MASAIIKAIILYPIVFVLEFLFIFTFGIDGFLYRYVPMLLGGILLFIIPLIISILGGIYFFKKSKKAELNEVSEKSDTEEKAFFVFKKFLSSAIFGAVFYFGASTMWLLFNFTDATQTKEAASIYENGNNIILILSIILFVSLLIIGVKRK